MIENDQVRVNEIEQIAPGFRQDLKFRGVANARVPQHVRECSGRGDGILTCRRLVGRLEDGNTGVVKQSRGAGSLRSAATTRWPAGRNPFASETSCVTCPRPPPSSQAKKIVAIDYSPRVVRRNE